MRPQEGKIQRDDAFCLQARAAGTFIRPSEATYLRTGRTLESLRENSNDDLRSNPRKSD
jgi:hypothetical protein